MPPSSRVVKEGESKKAALILIGHYGTALKGFSEGVESDLAVFVVVFPQVSVAPLSGHVECSEANIPI